MLVSALIISLGTTYDKFSKRLALDKIIARSSYGIYRRVYSSNRTVKESIQSI